MGSLSPRLEQWRAKLRAGEWRVLEHLVGCQIIGVCGSETRTRSYGLPLRDHITLLIVASSHQRRGYGRRLLKHVLDEHQATRSCTSLFVRPSNCAAIALYREQGFVWHKTIQDYYSDPPEAGLLLVRWRKRRRLFFPWSSADPLAARGLARAQSHATTRVVQMGRE